MQLPEHGQLTFARRAMQGAGDFSIFWMFRPGELMLFIGQRRCTSRCSFCAVGPTILQPERAEWLGNRPYGMGYSGGWGFVKSMLHPAGAVHMAQISGATAIGFGVSEPTLAWEYTYDTAKLAKAAGLHVYIESNGYTSPGAIYRLAPYVDAVLIGGKGSLDPEFYRRHMASDGAPAHVLAAIRAWHAAGVYVVVGDVLAPPQMQSDQVAAEAQRRFYGWIAEQLGPMTPLDQMPMLQPFGHPRAAQEYLLPSQDDETTDAYVWRIWESRAQAHEAGLRYPHHLLEDVGCHACGEVLLRSRRPDPACTPCEMRSSFCSRWGHEQHVTDGRCDWCGTDVPIVTLSRAELERSQATIQELKAIDPLVIAKDGRVALPPDEEAALVPGAPTVAGA
jgi:pyruvate-formate lyase-activating enzyme